jgi:hypothetical protein
MRWLAVLLVLGGCAVLQPGSAVVDGIVGEAVIAARAPTNEQAAALARAQQAFTSSGAAADRLRLAVLLATLPPPLRDDARAAGLLEPIADAAAPGVGRFAALLSLQIAERQRLLRDVERVSREVERAARADKERDKREEALKQQLEALRAIERGILEREEKLRRKKP